MVEELKSNKKIFKYKGKTLEELKALDVREFAKILPSQQKRFVLRNFQTVEKFVSRAKIKQEKGKVAKTHDRDMIVVPNLVGMRLGIYTGRQFENVDIMEEMLGIKLGELALTRKKTVHSKAGLGASKSKAPVKK